MKKIALILLSAAALYSCARTGSSGASDYDKIYLDAYMARNYPDARQTSLGCYILHDTEGSGAPVGSADFVRVEYTIRDLQGNYTSSTFAQTHKQLGTYSVDGYYGPAIWYRGEDQDNLTAGLEETISTMRIGGTRSAVIPGWLLATLSTGYPARYDSAEEYVKYCSGTTAIYDIHVVDAFDDEELWEKDSLASYIARNYPAAQTDTAMEGWYFIRTAEPLSSELLDADSTVYCNYTLYRLDGTILDTSIENVAKDAGIYSPSATYTPQQINMAEEYSEITMTSDNTDVVDGFANAFLHLHPGESCTVIFWSGVGYSSSGNGSKIPAYCPLRFDIQMTEEP